MRIADDVNKCLARNRPLKSIAVIRQIYFKGLLCAKHYSRHWKFKSEKLQLFSAVLDQKHIIGRVPFRIQEWLSWHLIFSKLISLSVVC